MSKENSSTYLPHGIRAATQSQKRSRAKREWAKRIRDLRKRRKIPQRELARLLNCSAMTISRWESGQDEPTARSYIELGKLAGKSDCWFYWERAGLQSSDVVRVLPERELKQLSSVTEPEMERAGAGSGEKRPRSSQLEMVPIPLLDATAATHGGEGDKKLNLTLIPARNVLGAPLEWCPNPRYTSLLRIRGHSMEPRIRDGDIAAVDSSQTDRAKLNGKIVIVSNEKKGLCVSRLQRYEQLDVLESENREYQAIVLDKSAGWHIVGKVLWWISVAP